MLRCRWTSEASLAWVHMSIRRDSTHSCGRSRITTALFTAGGNPKTLLHDVPSHIHPDTVFMKRTSNRFERFLLLLVGATSQTRLPSKAVGTAILSVAMCLYTYSKCKP